MTVYTILVLPALPVPALDDRRLSRTDRHPEQGSRWTVSVAMIIHAFALSLISPTDVRKPSCPLGRGMLTDRPTAVGGEMEGRQG